MKIKKIVAVKPRGFCAGVTRSIKVVEDCLKIFGKPVYVKHEIVHNKTVVSDLEKKGMITVENVAEIPEGAVAIFSAHGSSPKDFEEAKKRNIQVIDATCPLVTKVHFEMIRFIQEGYKVIYIGHHGHVEGLGVLGEAEKLGVKVPVIDNIDEVANLTYSPDEKVAILTQTTLNVKKTQKIIAEIKKKYKNVKEAPAEDICYATTNRQKAVGKLAENTDIILVVGSKNSSNSNRLAELVREKGKQAFLIDELSEIDEAWFGDEEVLGITSGASAPEYKAQEIIQHFVEKGAIFEELVFEEEKLSFTEPLELVRIKREKGI